VAYPFLGRESTASEHRHDMPPLRASPTFARFSKPRRRPRRVARSLHSISVSVSVQMETSSNSSGSTGARCHSRRGRPGAGQPVRCRDGAHRCGLSLGDAARRAGGPRDRLCGAAQCQPGPGQAGRAPHEASTSCRRHACGVAAACRAADVVAHAALPGRELGPAAAHRAGGPGAPG